MALAASGPAGAGFPASLLRLGGGTGSEASHDALGPPTPDPAVLTSSAAAGQGVLQVEASWGRGQGAGSAQEQGAGSAQEQEAGGVAGSVGRNWECRQEVRGGGEGTRE